MNHPGEIAPLCEIASPDMGIITNIGKIVQERVMSIFPRLCFHHGSIVSATPVTTSSSSPSPTKKPVITCGDDEDDSLWIIPDSMSSSPFSSI